MFRSIFFGCFFLFKRKKKNISTIKKEEEEESKKTETIKEIKFLSVEIDKLMHKQRYGEEISVVLI